MMLAGLGPGSQEAALAEQLGPGSQEAASFIPDLQAIHERINIIKERLQSNTEALEGIVFALYGASATGVPVPAPGVMGSGVMESGVMGSIFLALETLHNAVEDLAVPVTRLRKLV